MIPLDGTRGFDSWNLTQLLGQYSGVSPGAFIEVVNMLQVQHSYRCLKIGQTTDSRIAVHEVIKKLVPYS